MLRKNKQYKGPVVFVEGIHYPVRKDGHADLRRGLRITDEGTWRFASKNEPLHNETVHAREILIETN